jgi:uncharacterized protein (TIGR02246 family)
MTSKPLLAFVFLAASSLAPLVGQDAEAPGAAAPGAAAPGAAAPVSSESAATPPPAPGADAPDPEIASLESLAQRYVTAYNAKDLDGLVALYTSDAELIDEIDARVAIGSEEIRSLYESSFAAAPERQISLDVLSVRQLAENVVVEEGLARFSGVDTETEESLVSYSAILVKGEGDAWQIASSRELETISFEPDPLEAIMPLVGDWTYQGDQLQMELSLDLSNSGRFIMGSAVVTTPSEGAMETEIRIGYDADRDELRWWTFDELGGFGGGAWQPLESSWLVRTSGVTADGEPTSALQELTFESKDAIVWRSTRRFLDGVPLPDLDLRLARRPPSPASLFSTSDLPVAP